MLYFQVLNVPVHLAATLNRVTRTPKFRISDNVWSLAQKAASKRYTILIASRAQLRRSTANYLHSA